ncbi:V-ATPase subunit G [Nitzschia inconspicua]|uniref:V-type proton ATPase subunit G n=1 Tax=Nitzschia inconspicua TaxID=303405 RepID=A0A9K3M6W4_9STRA|nr:V-ATPase subunit G [Nitzschia inconspicua]KAG7374733.1 V-ATPase subunit G [Nitzschia inconspicua]
MSASTGAGIQELMAAETRASQIVAEARMGRGDRMKQAKKDAQELINAYREEKQEEFNNMVLSKGGSEGSASAKLQAETNKEINDMEAQFQKNAQKAVDVLLSKCCEVSLEVPTARVRATQKQAGITA